MGVYVQVFPCLVVVVLEHIVKYMQRLIWHDLLLCNKFVICDGIPFAKGVTSKMEYVLC